MSNNDLNTKPRQPIRQKLQRMMLLISMLALVVTSVAGILSMIRIQNDSEHALTDQMEINLKDIVSDRAALADSELQKYSGYIKNFADSIHEIYLNPDKHVKYDVEPPREANRGVIVLQRSLKNPDIKIEDIYDELGLLASVSPFWDTVLRNNQNLIGTIYAGTESGFLMSYDDKTEPESGDGVDIYFDHTSRDWYKLARLIGRTVFTNIYNDDYGRGLTISCSAPFYDAEDKFAGVVCMDVLISDLYKALLQIDLGEGTHAFLIDRAGKLITPDLKEYDLITESGLSKATLRRILAGEIGVTLDTNISNTYYAYAPIETTGWKLCIAIPESVILEPVRSVQRTVIFTVALFLTALLIILAIVFTAVRKFSARLTNPIVALGHDVEKISGGNLDYRAEIHENDEVGDLAKNFNDMAASLKEYIKNLAYVTAEKERIGAELNVATQIQADMLPRIFPPFPDRNEFDIYASMNPAKEVGGDFYDFFFIDDDHLAVVIADVSGKGVPAALFMVIAKTLIKNRALLGGTPAEILHDVNEQLCEGNDAELFVTVWLGILEISTGNVKAVNAGHEYPAIKRVGGLYEISRTKHSPAVATMEGMNFREHEFVLNPGDTVFLYTDGVPEATNGKDELLGNDRMIEALNKTVNTSAEDILASMKTYVENFTGDAPQFDDVTMICLKYFGGESFVKELNVTADKKNLDKVIAFVDEQLEVHDCAPKIQMQVDIAVEELFVNIANYAYSPESGGATVRVEIKEHPLSVEITFIDNGVPYDPLAKPDPDVTLSAEERDIGGLGIYMVKKSMDNISYEYKEGRNILKIEKLL